MFKVIEHGEYQKLLKASHGSPKADEVNGLSPGGVASRLGITRQAVHFAIVEDVIDAYRIERKGRLVAIIVPEAEVTFWEQKRELQHAATA